ncbi:MAG: site-specific integrase [Kiritimatiellia bacterium]
MAKSDNYRTRGTGSIFKTKNGVYTFRYMDASGKRKQVSLNTKNQKIANERAAQRSKLLAATSEEHAQIIIAESRIEGSGYIPLPFDEVWSQFEKRAKHKLRAGSGTMGLYEMINRQFSEWMTEHYPNVHNFTEIDAAIAEGYTTDLWNSGMAAGTFNDKKNGLGLITKLLSKDYAIKVNHWYEIDNKQGTKQKREPLDSIQISELLSALDQQQTDAQFKVLMLLGLYGGMRLIDAALIERSSISDGKVKYMPVKTQRTSKAIAEFYILPTLQRAIDGLPQDDNKYLLPQIAERYQKNTYFKTQVKTFIHAVTGKGEQRQIDQAIQARSLYGYHSLRHTFCTEMTRLGLSPAIISRMTGDRIATIERYYTQTLELGGTIAPGFEGIQALTAPAQANHSPERAQLKRLADILPIEAVKELIRLAAATKITVEGAQKTNELTE